MSDPDFKSPPNFSHDDIKNVPSLVTKLNQIALTIGLMIGTVGPNRGQTAWGSAIAGGSGSGGGTTVIGGGGGTGGTTPDLTPPPVPTNFAASAAISNLIVTCDNQTYTQGHGHLKSKLYGAIYSGTGPLPTFGTAVLIDEFTGTIDAVPENPATEWHLWLTWFSNDGVEGSPAGGTNGVVATTGQDVAKLLAALTGQITESQLYAALNSRINLIDGTSGLAGSVNARIQTETTARTSADTALASTVTTLSTNVGTLSSAISTETSARTSADTALANQITTVQSVVQLGEGNVVRDPGFVPGTGDWNAVITLQAASNAGTPAGAPSQYVAKFLGHFGPQSSTVPTTPGEVFDCSVWLAASSTTTNHCGIVISAYDAGNGLISSTAAVDAAAGVNSTWRQVTGTYTAPASAATLLVNLWIAQTGPGPDVVYFAQPVVNRRAGSGSINYAAIQTEASTRAGVDGGLLAQYTVKVDINGYVSGFGLASTTNGATPSSAFAVRADQFYVASPSGPGITPIVPFIVVTVPTTINGVAVPTGVFMDAAYVLNGTITNAKIGNLAVDDAKIASLSVAKLVAGSITTGQYIQSSSYIAGSQGWRIDGNGNAEFSFAMIRGTLAASQIAAGSIDVTKLNTRGLTVQDVNGTVILGAGLGQQGGNDAATALNFNPNFAAWTNTYPDNWVVWRGAAPGRSFSTIGGGPYVTSYSISAGDLIANGRGMVASSTPGAPLPAGTVLTGSFMANVLGNAGGTGKPGYMIRLWTDSGLTAFVDNIIPVANTGVSGWQRVPFAANAGGAAIYKIDVYQMAGWSGMPGGMWSAGSSVSFGPFTFDFDTPVDSTQLAATVNNAIADRLSKSAPSILSSTVFINATTGAGFVAGNLTWDSAGNPISGHGVAMTPGGLVGVNTGGVTTFSIDAVTGNAYFAGQLAVGVASKTGASGAQGTTTLTGSSQSTIGSNVTVIPSGVVTNTGANVSYTASANIYVDSSTPCVFQITMAPTVDGVVQGLMNPSTVMESQQTPSGTRAAQVQLSGAWRFPVSAGTHVYGVTVTVTFYSTSSTSSIAPTTTHLTVFAIGTAQENLA